MKKYAYFHITWSTVSGTSGIYLHSSDMQTLEWLIDTLDEAMLKEFKAKMRVERPFRSFDGLNPLVKLSGLKGRDGTVAFWLVQQLGSHGWEPFASNVHDFSRQGAVALRFATETE